MNRRPTLPRNVAQLLGLAILPGVVGCATSLYGTVSTPPRVQDADGDGHFAEIDDCDDTDPTVNPGAAEIPGDGIDQNCDGVDGEAQDTGST